MIKIRDIEKAISDLPRKDFAKFRDWFHKYESMHWDKQLESDIKSGKLNALANEAFKDFKEGKAKEL